MDGGGSEALSVEAAMTLTQAIGKAGACIFAAAPASVTLSREDSNGVVRDYAVVNALRDGSEKDIYLEPGDRSTSPGAAEGWSLGSLQRADLDHSVLDRRRRRRILREE